MGTMPRLAHVVLMTGRIDEMAQWYCALLRGHVVYSGHGMSFVTFDEEHHRIAFTELPAELSSAQKPLSVGMHHMAFTFDTLDDLLDRCQELAAEGIRPAAPVQHGVTTSMYYRDPDGNFVEMQIDNFATAEESTAYMRSPEFDLDPFGPAFDPELMAQARGDGATVAELITRSWAAAGPPQPDPKLALSS